MAEPSEPKKETVRIAVPPSGPAVTSGKDTVPLTGVPMTPPPPARTPIPQPPTARPSVPSPSNPAPVTASAQPPPIPRPPVPRPPGATTAVRPATEPVTQPTKETARLGTTHSDTARINLAPEPLGPASMSKTQPLITMTDRLPPPNAPVIAAPVEEGRPTSAMPIGLCWALLVISAITLLVEIWNYIS